MNIPYSGPYGHDDSITWWRVGLHSVPEGVLWRFRVWILRWHAIPRIRLNRSILHWQSKSAIQALSNHLQNFVNAERTSPWKGKRVGNPILDLGCHYFGNYRKTQISCLHRTNDVSDKATEDFWKLCSLRWVTRKKTLSNSLRWVRIQQNNDNPKKTTLRTSRDLKFLVTTGDLKEPCDKQSRSFYRITFVSDLHWQLASQPSHYICQPNPRLLKTAPWMTSPHWQPKAFEQDVASGWSCQDLEVVRITPIYKPCSWPFGRGPTTLLRGLIY